MHVGIRGPLYSARDLLEDAELGFQVVHAGDVDDIGVRGIVERARARVQERRVYVSLDIDVLDPGFAALDLVGADVVEVAPVYDHSEITGIAVAHAAYELLSAMGSPAPQRRVS